jgi:multidrug efflux system membrane fusion protein
MKTKSFLAIAGIAALLFTGCSRERAMETNSEEVVCVKAESLVETTAAVPIQCAGILSSKRLIKQSFKTGGIIARIYVDEGSSVKKGQLLASLEMTEIAAQVDQAKLALDKAERDLKRVKSLYADTVATLEQLQDATSSYEVALENWKIAGFNQKYSSIVAPANGKVIARLAEEHELVGPGMPVIVFTEQGKDEWLVKAGVSDKDAVKIKMGDRAEAFFDAFPDKTFPAYVSQVAEMVDPQSGTFEVEITVDPKQERLINGLMAKVTIESLNKQLVTLVPPEAVTEADGRKGFVYIVEDADTSARKVEVTIAYLEDNYIAVTEPINKLGIVITEGASYLEDGSKISVRQ